jgi:hypothetical protein
MVKDISKIDSHTAIACSNLLTQDSYKPDFEGLLRAIVEPLQDIENILFELYKNRSLNDATGYYLNRIGGIIGEERNYRNDEDYRLAILIRIISNNGGGTADEILIILSSIYQNSEIEYRECGDAFFQIQIKQETRPVGINQLLRKLTPIAVNMPTIVHLCTGRSFQFAENSKAIGTLLLNKDGSSEVANTSEEDDINISFGTFEAAEDAFGFAEIIVNRCDLNLSDGSKYLVKKKKPLEVLRSYQDYTIKGGGRFSELITNE